MFDAANPAVPPTGHGNVTRPLGKIALLVTFGDQKNFRMETIVFDIADTLLPYNDILAVLL